MPAPAMLHAIIAPNGPVALPKVRGSEKIPAPTIDPTTIAVKANRESFCVNSETMGVLLRSRCGEKELPTYASQVHQQYPLAIPITAAEHLMR